MLTKRKMGDLIRIKHGFPFLGEHFTDEGEFIVLTPGNFFEAGGFKRTPGKEKFYDADFPKEYLCSEGDLVVAMTQQAEGLLGSTALIPESGVYLHNQRIGLISWDKTLADKFFIYYLFMISSIRQQIRRTASGSKVKHTSPERIYDVIVWTPDVTTQERIGSILQKIDRKISLNNAINAELESAARTLYDYWFTQFDFPDKNGKPYRASGGAMIWSEELKREIPNGWKVARLKDVTDIVLGGTPGTSVDEYWGGEFHWLNSGEVSNFPVVDSELYVTQKGIEHSATKLMPKRTTIISITGNIRASILAIETCANQSVVGVYETELLRCQYLYPIITGMLALYTAISTGNCQTHINKGTVEDTKIVIPTDEVLNAYYAKSEPLYKMIFSNSIQSKDLTELRDFLLPLLMNGQVRVEA